MRGRCASGDPPSHQSVRQILTWAASRGLCESPPARTKTPKVKRVIEPLPLRPAELEALLSEAPASWSAPFAAIAMHGLRPGEARFLRWGDISRGRLHVRGAIDSVGEEHEPKASSTRAVPLDPLAAGLLAELPSGASTDRVFLGLGLPGPRPSCARRSQGGIAGAKWRVLYDLRHSYATLNIMLAVGPATLARRMGNSVKVCMDTYAAWWEDLAPDAEVTVSGGARSWTGRRRLRFWRARGVEIPCKYRAGDGARTRDIQLGRPAAASPKDCARTPKRTRLTCKSSHLSARRGLAGRRRLGPWVGRRRRRAS